MPETPQKVRRYAAGCSLKWWMNRSDNSIQMQGSISATMEAFIKKTGALHRARSRQLQQAQEGSRFL
jgi:hypothetical protein